MNKEHIEKACQDLAELLIKKNSDYGNSVQEQFEEYGLSSILIRLDDKLKRLKNLHKQGSEPLIDESKEETLEDLAGYALLGLICMQLHEK
jgi:hypothetical protein